MSLFRQGRSVFAALALAVLCSSASRAGSILVSGAITQDTADLSTTAVNNPSLNSIVDGDLYSVTLDFAGAISGPGTFALTSVLFTDVTQSVTESAFFSGSMTITQSAGIDTFSVLGCLIDPSTCLLGNQLDLNFQIPSAGLTGSGVTAQAVSGITPSMDLLEDGGSTDIQGTTTQYSQTAGVSGVPEPSSAALALFGIACILGRFVCRRNKS